MHSSSTYHRITYVVVVGYRGILWRWQRVSCVIRTETTAAGWSPGAVDNSSFCEAQLGPLILFLFLATHCPLQPNGPVITENV